MSTEQKWTTVIQSHLMGRRIVDVKYMTTEEADELGWYQRPIVITLDDGTELTPMSDDEGNDGGAVATNIEDLPTIPVL